MEEAPAAAEAPIRALYAGVRPLLHPALDRPDLDPRARSALDALGVPRLDDARVVEDLERALAGRSSLADPAAVAFPGSADRAAAILDRLADAPPDLGRRAAALPLFPADGALRPAALDAAAVDRVIALAPGPHADRLRAFCEGARPILADGARSGPAGRLLARLGVRRARLGG